MALFDFVHIGSAFSMRGFGRLGSSLAVAGTRVTPKAYMEYNRDLFRHFIRNNWYEVARSLTSVVRNLTNLVRNTIPKGSNNLI